MSVLKEKRTVSKAEYVNTANQIYVETVGFLTRLSARYSRLIAEGTAQLAGEVMDHTEKANKIYPSDEQRKAQRKAHLLEALASLSALDVRLTHAYLVMYQNPQGCFTAPSGKTVPTKGGHGQAGPHGAEPGRTDRPGGHPAAEYPGERQEAEISHFMGVSLKTRREAGRLSPLTAANVWCRSVNSSNSNNFCLVNTDGSANNNNANNSWALAP